MSDFIADLIIVVFWGILCWFLQVPLTIAILTMILVINQNHILQDLCDLKKWRASFDDEEESEKDIDVWPF